VADAADYGRSILLDAEFRLSEVRRVAQFLENQAGSAARNAEYEPGVSVIMPTYQGRDRILGSLDSLAQQDLPATMFEVIVVANGPDDGTADLVRRLAGESTMSIRVLATENASAGGARNIGLAAARKSFVTFVDDDDYVEPGFLSSLLAESGPDRIVSAPIRDLYADGTESEASPLAVRLRELEGRASATPVESVPWLLGLNACKLIPTVIASELAYRTDLRSGEDIAYMSGLLGRDLKVVAAKGAAPRAYIRRHRDDSVSRRPFDFSFAVTERLAVMRSLDGAATDQKSAFALRELIRAQAGFVARYVDERPGERERVARAVAESGVTSFPWELLNRGKARDLAIAYCFAPYLDSSGVVAAKAIAERNRLVDVISADMQGVRQKDAAVGVLAQRWIDGHAVIPTEPSFAGWDEISDFARKAAAQADTWHARKGGYETLYTRALWIGSHVAGALFKLNHWDVRWTAEFSDPLGRGVDGARRPGKLRENDVTERLRRAIRLAGVDIPEEASLFEFMELATYVLADEVVFTNANQRDYMLSLIPVRLAAKVLQKAVVRPHPAPVPEAYRALPGSYQLPTKSINLGYFGSFYGNRTLDELLIALVNLPNRERSRVRLHVFCNKPEDFTAEIRRYGLSANVYVNSYLSYMDFLSVSTRFDVLIAKDVDSRGSFEKNPFLPSKYSDYRGSGVPVWAIIDPSSPMSGMDVAYRSEVGDSVGALDVLKEICDGKTPKDSSRASNPQETAKERIP
jgi:glycosyltransferase involved in cell wall biosynthesis